MFLFFTQSIINISRIPEKLQRWKISVGKNVSYSFYRFLSHYALSPEEPKITHINRLSIVQFLLLFILFNILHTRLE